ncbi:MAG: hypothetical protein BRD57_03430 [Proteobacteria bacterium SW_6_67_9]|nr:MAG: hypothetical protein BRD57_03430 [Proteobacteria bacterium SW_6_67_9]
MGNIARAEADPARRALGGPTDAAALDRLLEQRYARLVPQIAAEQVGRAGCRGHDGTRYEQGRIEIGGGPAGRHLQMDLQRCRRRLEHHVRVLGEQTLPPRYVDVQRASAALAQDLIVERGEAGHRCHVGPAHVGLAQRWQDADHDQA